MAIKAPPMIRPQESDDEYDQRLTDAGITPDVFEKWFESIFPVSGSSFSQSSFDGGDEDGDDDDSDEGTDDDSDDDSDEDDESSK